MSTGAHVLDIEAFGSFSNDLLRFARDAGGTMLQVEMDVRRTLGQLQQHVADCIRNREAAADDVESARYALARCEESDDASCASEGAELGRAQADLQEAEEQLAEARRWFDRVQQVAQEFEIEARRLTLLITEHTPKSCAFLQRRMEELERYADGFSVPGETHSPTEMTGEGGPGGRAAATGLFIQQARLVADRMRSIGQLQPERWAKVDLGERMATLREVEAVNAEVQGRPTVPLQSAPMDPCVYGGYSDRNHEITVNSAHVRSDNVREVLDTILHEGRHAYQHYAIQHPGTHPDRAEVERWRDNFEDYLRPDLYGQQMYENQPVEVDARLYASEVINQYHRNPPAS